MNSLLFLLSLEDGFITWTNILKQKREMCIIF